MNYLFFDVEGANCYNFVLKMCTFGYVIINEKFEVKSKIDVVMNPNCPFDKHIIRENMNAYPLSFYQTKPPFNYFYKSIKNILEGHKYIIGWSIENDVKYIYDACKRYNLNQINYDYIDMQRVYMDVFDLKSQPNLEAVCKQHGIEVDVIHKSDDDAHLTMLVTKVICQHLKITIKDLFEKYSQYVSNVEEFSSKQLTNKEIAIRINRRRIYNFIKTQKRKQEIHNPIIDENEIYGFDVKVIDSYAEDVRQLIKYIVNCGAKCSNNIQECTTLINIKRANGKKINRHKNIKTIDFHKLLDSLKEPIGNK